MNVHFPPEQEFTHFAPGLHSVRQPPPEHVVVRVEPGCPTKSQSRPEQSYAQRSPGPHTSSQPPFVQAAVHAPALHAQFAASAHALPVAGAAPVPTVQSYVQAARPTTSAPSPRPARCAAERTCGR